MKTKLECLDGWVEIERIIEDGDYGVKLTTNMEDEGELVFTLSYDCRDKADSLFNNLSKANPNELQAAILQMVGI